MPKFEGQPKFCPKHLKIHVCEEMSVTNKLKEAEDEIGARVRRLHGTQTEEEMAAEAAKANAAPAPGSIGAILAAAKNKIAETKAAAANDEIDKQTHAVTKDEVNDRMAALKARMAGGGGGTPAAGGDLPPAHPGTNSGLGQIIDHAREISKETWQDYKVPERSRMGEAPLPETKAKANSPTVEKSKPVKAAKPKNADKMPSIALEAAVIDEDDFDLDSLNEVPHTTPKSSASAKKVDGMMFTVEETQELIQEAVKKALKDVGLVKPKAKKTTATTKKTPAKKAVPAAKKPATAKKPAAKATSDNKKPSIAKNSTSSKTK